MSMVLAVVVLNPLSSLSEQAMLRGGAGDGDEEDNGMEALLIRKCFSSVTVSTNSKTVEK